MKPFGQCRRLFKLVVVLWQGQGLLCAEPPPGRNHSPQDRAQSGVRFWIELGRCRLWGFDLFLFLLIWNWNRKLPKPVKVVSQ